MLCSICFEELNNDSKHTKGCEPYKKEICNDCREKVDSCPFCRSCHKDIKITIKMTYNDREDLICYELINFEQFNLMPENLNCVFGEI
jgi:hypothetical protein